MSKKILGLDIGSNSIGWALLESNNGQPDKILDVGSRIFTKAVEEKTPTPKNAKRREARLARRVIQRRARRKQRMLNYLVSLGLLPEDLKRHTQPETILNELGDPYLLRAKALDRPLTPYELGRALLHLVQRRGFLSNRKTLIGDMVGDPDMQDVLNELEGEADTSSESAKEETTFKKDIAELRKLVDEKHCRTLGEYFAKLNRHQCKRNRTHNGGHLRTDRQMYREELDQIWERQNQHHTVLTPDVKEQIEHIIFHQRPLKLRSDRIGKCSLEPSRNRARIARLEYQRFRYLQDINNLKYFDPYREKWTEIDEQQRYKLVEFFEHNASITIPRIRKLLGLDKSIELNLEQGNKKLKGNITSCTIQKVFPKWDEYSTTDQTALLEDLLTINKKSVLKNRLMQHWRLSAREAIELCLLDFEPGHGNLSLKAINRLLPYLEKGQLYSDARVSAGYTYEEEDVEEKNSLDQPPETNNPIVNKALHELRRLVNAVIAEYGKPDIFRVEMARDLEMNTKRYKNFLKQQKDNTKANDEAVEKYRDIAKQTPHLKLSEYPSRADKIKYRLWKDQDSRCAYSGKTISPSILFGPEIDVDHILPYSMSLDDSYMNKVVCFASENRYKGQRTPIDAFSDNEERWNQITQRINHWDKKLRSKRDRFYQTADDLSERDFISSQLNDTRYISKLALEYLKPLGVDVTTSKGIITAWLRHQWGLDDVIGNSIEKDRVDHRHHAIDAVVTACVDRKFYNTLVSAAKAHERSHPELRLRDLHVDPPWDNLREDLKSMLDSVIVSHAPQKKLSGALHEETGVGYIEGVGNVVRKQLNPDFKQVDKIYDAGVREAVKSHLNKFGNDPKKAFADEITVFHLDGKTPIKRVRIQQSNTTLEKVEQTKFGVKNKEGEVFKWLAYGNLHHVEVIRNTTTGKYSGRFVTMMEANHRAKGIGMEKQPIIKADHGSEYDFICALHLNDLVRVDGGDIYRVRKLGQLNQGEQPRPTLNGHLDAQTDINEISDSIRNLMTGRKLELVKVNVLGKII